MKENKRHRTTIDSFKEYSNPHDISYQDYALILKTFNYLLAKEIMEQGTLYALPSRLGVIGVYKRKTLGKGKFDYNHYKDTGEKVWKKNLHSSVYAAFFKWSMKGPWTDLEGNRRSLFNFIANRDSKRTLAKHINESNTIYKYYDFE